MIFSTSNFRSSFLYIQKNSAFIFSYIFFLVFHSTVYGQIETEHSSSPPGIFRQGWGQRGVPLLINKKKRLEVFRSLPAEVTRDLPTLPPQDVQVNIDESRDYQSQSVDETFVMMAFPGDFVDISRSYLKFVKPVKLNSEDDFDFNCIRNQTLSISSGSEYFVYYYDPYLLIVGDGQNLCEVDMFYGIRPFDKLPNVPPKFEWWIEIHEYNSFRKGWIRFEDTLFERNFNPRYLRNFNNRTGIVADFETLFLYRPDNTHTLHGYYKVMGEYDKFEESFQKTCIFFFVAEPSIEFPNEFDFTALDINQGEIKNLNRTKGRLKYNWRGETATAVLQTEADFTNCTGERSTSRKPLYFYERTKNFPIGIGLVIRRDRYLRQEKIKDLPSETLLRDFQSLKSLRSDRYWNDPLRPAKEKFEELVLTKWEPVTIHKIDRNWVEISVRRMATRGWVQTSDLIYISQFNRFPEFRDFNQFLDDIDRQL